MTKNDVQFLAVTGPSTHKHRGPQTCSALPVPCCKQEVTCMLSHSMAGQAEVLSRSLEERSPRVAGRLTEGYLDHHRFAMTHLAI